MDNQKIILFLCGHFDDDLVNLIRKDVESEFHLPVTLEECNLDITGYYNPVRRQYEADGLMHIVSELSADFALKAMGLFRVDLFIPILTYIFGQAKLNGDAGIVSLYRLRNELYGLPADQGLLIERFSKVVIHELGHAFGLIHCHNPVCIMRSSTYVEDIDQKEGHFCHSCRKELDESLEATSHNE